MSVWRIRRRAFGALGAATGATASILSTSHFSWSACFTPRIAHHGTVTTAVTSFLANRASRRRVFTLRVAPGSPRARASSGVKSSSSSDRKDRSRRGSAAVGAEKVALDEKPPPEVRRAEDPVDPVVDGIEGDEGIRAREPEVDDGEDALARSEHTAAFGEDAPRRLLGQLVHHVGDADDVEAPVLEG